MLQPYIYLVGEECFPKGVATYPRTCGL